MRRFSGARKDFVNRLFCRLASHCNIGKKVEILELQFFHFKILLRKRIPNLVDEFAQNYVVFRVFKSLQLNRSDWNTIGTFIRFFMEDTKLSSKRRSHNTSKEQYKRFHIHN